MHKIFHKVWTTKEIPYAQFLSQIEKYVKASSKYPKTTSSFGKKEHFREICTGFDCSNFDVD